MCLSLSPFLYVPFPFILMMTSGGLWFGLLVPSVWLFPAAELIQLRLLRSVGNLPVSERVQLPHLSQLRLYHGRLGVHREGDWPGSRPWWAVLPDLPPPACCTHNHRSCRNPKETQDLLQKLSPLWNRAWIGGGLPGCLGWSVRERKGVWGIWRCEGFLPRTGSVFIPSPFFLLEHPTRLLDVTSHCVRGHMLSRLSVCTFSPSSIPKLDAESAFRAVCRVGNLE